MPAQGTTTLDFGNGSTDTKVSVSQPSISGSSLVEAWIFPTSTVDNTTTNHWVEELKVVAGDVQNGVGFTIYGKCTTGLAHGQYTVGWVWN